MGCLPIRARPPAGRRFAPRGADNGRMGVFLRGDSEVTLQKLAQELDRLPDVIPAAVTDACGDYQIFLGVSLYDIDEVTQVPMFWVGFDRHPHSGVLTRLIATRHWPYRTYRIYRRTVVNAAAAPPMPTARNAPSGHYPSAKIALVGTRRPSITTNKRQSELRGRRSLFLRSF